MNAYELAEDLENSNGLQYITKVGLVSLSAKMLRQQAQAIATLSDRIAELEKEVLMWENAEVPTEVMADLIQELERGGFITTPQIKELSDEEILSLSAFKNSSYDVFIEYEKEDLIKFARAILKKASEK